MKTIYLIIGLVLCMFARTSAYAQCVTTNFSDTTIGCGNQIELVAVGFSAGTPVLEDDFNDSILGVGWASSPNVVFTNPCSPSLDGSSTAWIGDNIPLPRTLETVDFNLSCGAQICFELDFASDEFPNHCEDPDLIDEGVYLQYSTDGGTSWVDIFYFQPSSTMSSPYYQWDTYCFMLPQAGWSSSTRIRWVQEEASSLINDHWGLDNVVISPSNCGYVYDWLHVPGTSDANNQFVSPSDTTVYYITYGNGLVTCTDSIIVNVLPMDIEIVMDTNSIDCGDCTGLSVDVVTGASGSIRDDFDPDIDPFMWADIQGATTSTICGGGGTGNALYFSGDNLNRYAQTTPMDATANCPTVDFCLYMGNTASGGATAGCENNELGDDVVLEYSTDGGSTWVNMATYSQGLWDGANFQQCFSEVIPVGAQTTSTEFRWRQVDFFPSTMPSDNWTLDEVFIGCSSIMNYTWTTGSVDDTSSPSPMACPTSSELYTVIASNTQTGCTASDTATLVVLDNCSCFFTVFDGSVANNTGATLDISGSFEFDFSPITGTIRVEATNNTGTYSQSFSPPFNNNTLYNYLITGIPNDGSVIDMEVYFTDSLSCTETFSLSSTICMFTEFDGQLIQQVGGTMDVSGTFKHVFSPYSGVLTITAQNGSGTAFQTINAPFFNNQVGNYTISGLINDGSVVTVTIVFSDSLLCSDTIILSPNVGVHQMAGDKGNCLFSPNPMNYKGKLSFTNQTTEEVTITVVNARGQLVMKETTSEELIELSRSQLESGIYFYSVRTDENGELCKGKFAVSE